MTKRVVPKIGDIFSARIDEKTKKYFQLIALDLTQLNSDVVRAFENEHPIDANPDLDDVVKGNVQFYAHCITRWGVKLGYWEKAGKSEDIGSLGHILFRGTNDYGRKKGEDPIRISNRWYVWHIGDPDFTRVGSLEGENRQAEIGMVINPESIIYRLRTGEYDFPFYPGFE